MAEENVRIYRNWLFPNLYFADLMGGEFSNCSGQGRSPESATISLKIRVNQLRRQRLESKVSNGKAQIG